MAKTTVKQAIVRDADGNVVENATLEIVAELTAVKFRKRATNVKYTAKRPVKDFLGFFLAQAPIKHVGAIEDAMRTKLGLKTGTLTDEDKKALQAAVQAEVAANVEGKTLDIFEVTQRAGRQPISSEVALRRELDAAESDEAKAAILEAKAKEFARMLKELKAKAKNAAE